MFDKKPELIDLNNLSDQEIIGIYNKCKQMQGEIETYLSKFKSQYSSSSTVYPFLHLELACKDVLGERALNDS